MRFSHDFHRYQVPEWTSQYVPYPSLKRLFNETIIKAGTSNIQPDLTGLFTAPFAPQKHFTLNQRYIHLSRKALRLSPIFTSKIIDPCVRGSARVGLIFPGH